MTGTKVASDRKIIVKKTRRYPQGRSVPTKTPCFSSITTHGTRFEGKGLKLPYSMCSKRLQQKNDACNKEQDSHDHQYNS